MGLAEGVLDDTEFAGRGANVIINSRSNREQAESVAKEAQALGAKTLVVMGTAGEPLNVPENP